jgi:hypothetical protein
MGKIIDFFDEILSKSPDTYLRDELEQQVKEFILKESKKLLEVTLEDQKHILKLCMDNFGLFTLCLSNMDSFPNSLKYALISKAMYSFGSCGVPEGIIDFNDVLQSETRTWWDEHENSAYMLREQLLRDPRIGLEPILDEFPNCSDIDLISAMLSNPVISKELIRSIIEGTHLVFSEYDLEDLEDLIEQAQGLV